MYQRSAPPRDAAHYASCVARLCGLACEVASGIDGAWTGGHRRGCFARGNTRQRTDCEAGATVACEQPIVVSKHPFPLSTRFGSPANPFFQLRCRRSSVAAPVPQTNARHAAHGPSSQPCHQALRTNRLPRRTSCSAPAAAPSPCGETRCSTKLCRRSYWQAACRPEHLFSEATTGTSREMIMDRGRGPVFSADRNTDGQRPVRLCGRVPGLL